MENVKTESKIILQKTKKGDLIFNNLDDSFDKIFNRCRNEKEIERCYFVLNERLTQSYKNRKKYLENNNQLLSGFSVMPHM